MAEPDRLQPCLFDRLIDENPDSVREAGRGERAISLSRYREGVLRDLRWLLNAKAHLDDEEAAQFGEVARSVLNFGISDLCGKLSSSLDLGAIEHELLEAIRRFEPRIMASTLSVKAVEGGTNANPSLIGFEIHGQLWANPLPEQFFLKTQIDLETGQCL